MMLTKLSKDFRKYRRMRVRTDEGRTRKGDVSLGARDTDGLREGFTFLRVSKPKF